MKTKTKTKMPPEPEEPVFSYYGLSLLSYLQDSHPERAGDTVFISSRADEAAEAYSQAIREGLSHPQAEEQAVRTLFSGLVFSKHDTLTTILWNEFSNIVSQDRAAGFARRMLPACEKVFSHYLLSDEFAATPDYDRLCTELTGCIDLWLEENEL
jgi:hypothetical protein